MATLLEMRNIEKSYDGIKVLKNFNLALHEGEFLCVVGTSGSGKTTIMKMVNGLLLPDKGDVFLQGECIKSLDLIKVRRKIGYAIQGNGLFPHMTVSENIGYVLQLEKRPKEEIDKTVDEMLALVGLASSVKDRYPAELSGGQQQRVGIARAYANKPDILLMDEPFGAVDSITRYQLQNDLKEIHQKTKCTVMFITHDIYEAYKLSTHILVMDNGEIEQFGTREEVWENPKSEFVKNLIRQAR